MNITFDPDAKRATDLDTGMAVEWGGYDPYPQEMEMYFTLYWKGKVIKLRAGWGDNFTELSRQHPDWSIIEVMEQTQRDRITSRLLKNPA